MSDALRFYRSIKDVETLTQGRLIDLFAYFLQEYRGYSEFRASQIAAVFRECDLTPPARLSTHLPQHLGGKTPTYIKTREAYRLHQNAKLRLAKLLGIEGHALDVPPDLRALEGRLADGPRKAFLKEALDAFGVEAYRATIVMVWLLTLDHLFELLLTKHLAAFNAVLATNTDKRVRIAAVHTKDDFGEIPEGKLIEFMRSAQIITNDVRKILDQKLGTRNSAAHPSTVTFSRAKTVDFCDDLLSNVITKYPL